LVISENFARCIARISGDGYLYYRYIRYSNKCPELIREFKEDMVSEFGGINFTEGISNSGTPFVQVHGKNLIKKFTNYLEDYRSTSIKIPNEIKQGSKRLKSVYLRALYDDEGCATLRLNNNTKEWKRNLTLCSNSIMLLKEVEGILVSTFKIKTNKIIRNKNAIKDRCYVLAITGKDNFNKFKEKIGFLSPRKRKRLEMIIISYDSTSKNKISFEKLKRELLIP